MSEMLAPAPASNTGTCVHDAIFKAWTCAFGEARVVYLSGPITTGRRFVDAVVHGLSADVAIAENARDLSAAATNLRRSAGVLVVEPSSLEISGWSQEEYILLWMGLIERHAGEVRFMPEWQFSLGCALEFVHATATGIQTVDLSGTSLTVTDASAMIASAERELDALALRAPQLERLRCGLVSALERLREL